MTAIGQFRTFGTIDQSLPSSHAACCLDRRIESAKDLQRAVVNRLELILGTS